MSIELGGGSYSATEIIQAIAESNDPQPVDLSSLENKTALIYSALQSIETRITAIESKLVNLPTDWSIH